MEDRAFPARFFPNGLALYPEGYVTEVDFETAVKHCKARGYIRRKSNPSVKYWKSKANLGCQVLDEEKRLWIGKSVTLKMKKVSRPRHNCAGCGKFFKPGCRYFYHCHDCCGCGWAGYY